MSQYIPAWCIIFVFDSIISKSFYEFCYFLRKYHLFRKNQKQSFSWNVISKRMQICIIWSLATVLENGNCKMFTVWHALIFLTWYFFPFNIGIWYGIEYQYLSLQPAYRICFNLGLSSIPAVSMDRWRSPSDNRYARNAGVSIRYKK